MRRLPARAAVGLAAATVLGLPAVAFAHAHVVSTRPGSGATLDTPPGRVVVVFDDPVTLVPRAVQVTDPHGMPVRIGAPAVSADGRTLSAGVRERLPAGGYQVAWRVRSDDGHIETGSFTFDLATGNGAHTNGADTNGADAGGAPMMHGDPPAAAAPPEPAQPVWPVATAAALAAVAGLGAGLAVHRSLRAARDTG